MENNPEYLAAKERFDHYYEETIVPSLQEVETKRKRYLLWFILLCMFVSVWVGLIITGKISLFHGGDEGLIICFAVLAVCAPLFMYYKKSKESILPSVIGFFGDFHYDFRPKISDSLLEKSKIMPTYSSIKTDDSFSGKYQDVSTVITEYARFERVVQKKENVKRLVEKKCGHGIIFFAEMKKNFTGQTIVVKDKGFMNKFTHYKGLSRVGLESVEFEKAYEVYSDDQVEARYILTAVMLEYIMELKKVFPKTTYSFFDNQVFINVELKGNLFECSSFFRSVLNKKRIEKNFKQLYLLFSIVDTLRLNQNKLL